MRGRPTSSKKIGEILVERGLVTPEIVATALASQKFFGGRMGSMLVEMGKLDERDLIDALTSQKNARHAEAMLLECIPKWTLDLVPAKLAVCYRAIPLHRDNRRLTVAMADPNDLLALDELAFITGCVIEPLLVTERSVINALQKCYGTVPEKRRSVALSGAALTAVGGRARASTATSVAPSHAVATAEAPASLNPLEEASRRLARVEFRDDIADVLMWCTEGLFRRTALFIFQKTLTLGWTGRGGNLTPELVRQVVMPVDDVSVFAFVRNTQSHYLGPLPHTPANERFMQGLGGGWPPAALVVPFGFHGRALGCLYAEDETKELESIDLTRLFRLIQKIGLALEILLLRSKIAVP